MVRRHVFPFLGKGYNLLNAVPPIVFLSAVLGRLMQMGSNGIPPPRGWLNTPRVILEAF